MSHPIPPSNETPQGQQLAVDDLLPRQNTKGQVLHPYSGQPMSHDEFKKYMHKLQLQAKNDEELRKALLGYDKETRQQIEKAFLEQLEQPRDSTEERGRKKPLPSVVQEKLFKKGI